MPRPFNFYQYEGSGAGAFIAPYVTQFTGFYFPQDLAQGQDVGFVWRLFDDDLLRPLKYQIRFTGEQKAGYNLRNDISIAISGNVFPNFQDSGDFSFSLTGNVVSGAYLYISFDIPFSGQQVATNQDLNTLSCAISGQSPITLNELAESDLRFTGRYVSGYNLNCELSMGFRGSFVKRDRDSASIDLSFTQVSFNVGTSRATMSTGDACSLDFSFSSVIFKQA